MCITVGKVSFDDWLRLTSSFGWIGFFEPSTPPASWIARFEITSLAFMLVCVPEPVWKTTSGNSPSSLPSITSCAARTIRSTFSCGSWPSSRFASAAHFLRMPSARITGRPQRKRSTPIGKLSRDRSVCAPQRCSAGTGTSPSASSSMRYGVWSWAISFSGSRCAWFIVSSQNSGWNSFSPGINGVDSSGRDALCEQTVVPDTWHVPANAVSIQYVYPERAGKGRRNRALHGQLRTPSLPAK